MIFPATFTILTGIGIIGMWTVSYVSKQIPELESEPIRSKFHLSAEFATALLLIFAGIGLFSNQGWAISVYLIALGMLIYTLIVSPGI